MELQEIKQLSIELMDAVKARGVAEFSLETDDLNIAIKMPETVQAAAVPVVAAAAAPAATAVEAAQPIEAAAVSGTPVEAPLVGVFYISPAPDAPPFVEVGQQVSKGDTLCIIEAMKTMNEITAPCSGVVSRILVQPGDLVEYKQTMMLIG